MLETVVLAGIACIVAALVGGGVKLDRFEIPVFASVQRQFALGLLGAVLACGGLVALGHIKLPMEETEVVNNDGQTNFPTKTRDSDGQASTKPDYQRDISKHTTVKNDTVPFSSEITIKENHKTSSDEASSNQTKINLPEKNSLPLNLPNYPFDKNMKLMISDIKDTKIKNEAIDLVKRNYLNDDLIGMVMELKENYSWNHMLSITNYCGDITLSSPNAKDLNWRLNFQESVESRERYRTDKVINLGPINTKICDQYQRPDTSYGEENARRAAIAFSKTCDDHRDFLYRKFVAIFDAPKFRVQLNPTKYESNFLSATSNRDSLYYWSNENKVVRLRVRFNSSRSDSAYKLEMRRSAFYCFVHIDYGKPEEFFSL